jgi:cytosine/adenosine deaminase-related metal-dependent hydrolase
LILYRARWVLPISTPPLPGGVVGVEGDSIMYVGPPEGAPSGATHDLGDAVLLPGLVNAHSHLELTVMRGFLEGLDFAGWIDRLWRSKKAVLDGGRMLDSARLGVMEGLIAGVTTFGDTASSAAPFHAMLEFGVRGIAFQEVFGPDPADADAAIADLGGRIDALAPLQTGEVRLGVSPHAPYTVSDALFRATARYATRAGLPIAVHIAESHVEQALVTAAGGVFAEGLRGRGISVEIRGRSPVELLARTGVLAARPLLIHCVQVDVDDLRLIAGGSTVAHCPVSNAKLGHGIAPIRELLDAGVAVGIGTDSVASNDRMHLLEEAHVASIAQSARLRQADVIPAREALQLATLGGARALHVDHLVGSLEVGKQADLTAFALDQLHAVPAQEPENLLVHSCRGQPASFVCVGGQVRVRDGRLQHFDPDVPRRVQGTADLLRQWLAQQS